MIFNGTSLVLRLQNVCIFFPHWSTALGNEQMISSEQNFESSCSANVIVGKPFGEFWQIGDPCPSFYFVCQKTDS
jgi:hypothetical protein